jgi:hypothetical protein
MLGKGNKAINLTIFQPFHQTIGQKILKDINLSN